MSDTDLPGSERPHDTSMPSGAREHDRHMLDREADRAASHHVHEEMQVWERVARALADIHAAPRSRRPERLLECVLSLLRMSRGRVIDVDGVVLAERGAMSTAQLQVVVDVARELARSRSPESRVYERLAEHPRLATLAAGPDGASMAVLFPASRDDRVTEVVYADAPSHAGPVAEGVRRAVLFLVGHATEAIDAGRDPSAPILTPDDVVGAHPLMVRVRGELERLVSTRTPVVIEGEQGVGKTRVARILHDGRTPRRPFVVVTARALASGSDPRDALGSDIRDARGGTLYLSDADELGADALRDLVSAAGDVRLVLGLTGDEAARRVAAILTDGDVAPAPILRVPALAGRPDDTVPLARELLREIAAHEGVSTPRLSPAARDTIVAGPWPGNVDELRARLARAVALVDGGSEIDAEHLRADPGSDGVPAMSPPDTFREETDRFEAKLIGRALVATSWNVSRAARQLDISRQHLHNLVKKHGLTRTRG